jgi:L-cysteate sulfo-lyase
VRRDGVWATCDDVGAGDDIPTQGMIQIVRLLAQIEGLLFDPVYSGKARDRRMYRALRIPRRV